MAPRNSHLSKNSRSRLFGKPIKEETSRRSSISPAPTKIINKQKKIVNNKKKSTPKPKPKKTSPIQNPKKIILNAKTSPVRILSKLLQEAKLTYDDNIGTLNGDSVVVEGIGELKLDTLNKLNCLFKVFKKSLRNIAIEDERNSLAIKKILLKNSKINAFTLKDLEFIKQKKLKLSDFGITEKIKQEISNNGPDKTIDENFLQPVNDEIDEDKALSAMKQKSTEKRKIKCEDGESYKRLKLDDDSNKIVNTEFSSLKLSNITEKLGLFEPNKELEKKGDIDYLKKLYGVKSFPQDYLENYLTGPIPNIDFNQQKEIKNKTNFSNFVSYIDHYFRSFDDDDLIFLKKKYVYSPHLDNYYANQFNNKGSSNHNNTNSYNPKIHPFIVPNLGKSYLKVWAEEDGNARTGDPLSESMKDAIVPKKSANELTDIELEKDNVSCGPLVSRLLSALIKNDPEDEKVDEEIPETNNSLETNDPENNLFFPEYANKNVGNYKYDYSTLEERLSRELKFAGVHLNYQNEVVKRKSINGISNNEDILHDNFEETWIMNKQDDEISRELRRLQKELKVVNLRNNLRKKILFKKVYEEISFREFYNILENLNKQIDQYYVKKQKILVRHSKKHKKNNEEISLINGGSLSHQQVIDKTLNSLIDKRNKWIERIGPLFDYKENIQLREYPELPIFNNKILKINENNFEEFYEIYSEFSNDKVDFSNDDEETNINDGILLAEGIKIQNDELKLNDSKDEVLKKIDNVKIAVE